MRRSLGLFILIMSLFAGPMAPSFSHAAPAPRVYNKTNLLTALKDWEVSLKDRAMDAFERDLEREFILRLRFQVERRYTGDDASLIRILAFLLELEEQPQNLSLSYTTSYLRELLEAVRTIREPNENLARFIRQFTEASGIKNVMSANQFLASRAYLNGQESVSAREMDEENWNDLAARMTLISEEDTTPVTLLSPLIPEAEAPVDEAIQLIGPGMPEVPTLTATEEPQTASPETIEAESLDPELLAELQGENETPTPALEDIIGSPPPPAPRIQSIRSTDDSATLR